MSKKTCPVCKGTAIATYRLYHDCNLRGKAPAPPPTDSSKAQAKPVPARRPNSRSVCPVCKQPGTETLVYCAGCRTAWIGLKPAPAVSPNVPAQGPVKA